MRDAVTRLRTRDQRDEGWTLVELLVVMALFAMIMVMTFSVLITVQKQTRDNMARADQVQQAKLGLMQIDRQVRSGNVVVDPATSGELERSLRVYTQTDGVRRCVQWQVHGDALRYRSWDPGAATAEGWRIVAHHVQSGAGVPTPFEKVTAAGGSQAQSVRVRLWIKSPQSGGKPAEVTTVLTGRNTIYGYPADVCSPVPPA